VVEGWGDAPALAPFGCQDGSVRSQSIALIGAGLLFANSTIAAAAPARDDPAWGRQRDLREPGGPASMHVVVIVFENKEYAAIRGSSEAPYINSLADQYGLAERYFANTHPSLPNYLDLIAGGDFGISDDGEGYLLRGRTLVDQLAANGLSWRAYMEGMAGDRTAPCPFSSHGGYRKKHNPFAYFARIQGRSGRCRHVLPFRRLSGALATGLPNFTWITPNMCHDMHDCDVATGDAWLSMEVPKWLDRMSGHDLLIMTFDEGTSDEGGGGHVVTVVAGPGAERGKRDGTSYSHFSLLRTIEDAFGLRHLNHAGDRGVHNFDPMIRP
jgi:phosphatidylinositol-3-phosphatase